MVKTDAFGDLANVTPEALHVYSKMLRDLADQHDKQAELLKTQSVPQLRVKNLKTAARGLVALGAFLGAVTTAIVNGIAAEGVGQIEYGTIQLNRQLKRIQADTEASEDGADLANKLSPANNKRESGQTTVRKTKKGA